jgi:hypothetical protein
MIVRLGAAICGIAVMLACSSAAMAESGIASVYAYAGGKTASGDTQIPADLPERVNDFETAQCGI